MEEKLDEEQVAALRGVVKVSYASYPMNGRTIDKMIDQAIRSAYIRGYNNGFNDAH